MRSRLFVGPERMGCDHTLRKERLHFVRHPCRSADGSHARSKTFHKRGVFPQPIKGDGGGNRLALIIAAKHHATTREW